MDLLMKLDRSVYKQFDEFIVWNGLNDMFIKYSLCLN